MGFSVVIQEQDFDVAEEYQDIVDQASSAGAVVFFVGLVRDYYSKQEVTAKVRHIELQHYPEMTESLIAEIIEQAKQRYEIEAARVVHRVGRLTAGEQIVLVACASRHRDKAFEASQFIMDYLKTQATLWKREVGDKGEQWLGVKDKDKQALERWRSD